MNGNQFNLMRTDSSGYIFLTLFLFLVLSNQIFGGEPKGFVETKLPFSEQRFALIQQSGEVQSQEIKENIEEKSVARAALYSAIIPGAGQFYTKSYWRAALYAGLEIALWVANASYNDKGDTEDANMRQFGDENWSERRYWSHVYRKAGDNWTGPELDLIIEQETGAEILSENSYNTEVINELRKVESKIGTHSLPTTKTQQYYEMIYKYLHQFGVGWNDVAATFGDPYYYDTGSLNNPTPFISSYRDMRNNSNNYYDTANMMINLVILNHVVSAVDAALSAKSYNSRVQYSFQAHARRIAGEPVSMYGISLAW